MAYAAVLSLAKTIDLILNYRQDSISTQLNDQIVSINEYVIFLQAFLEHFPDKAKRLERRIRETTHVAENIIEFSLSDALLPLYERQQMEKKKRHENTLLRKPKQAAEEIESIVEKAKKINITEKAMEINHYYCHKLEQVAEEIESIAEKVMEIKSSIKDAGLGDPTTASSSSRVAPVHKDAMVGFEDDLMKIRSQLCRESSKLEAVPIVGMGGIGKTTLARNIYDDLVIREQFQIRAWVTVSQDYSVQEIVSGLLVSMKAFDAENKSVGAHRVYQTLKGRRYLIVLDDIWSIKAWDELRMMFPDDGNGSRIMLTTRLSDVATYADSFSPVHEMRLMDDNQSWNLLRQKVFKQGPCPVGLEHVGRMIARSCRGLPLALVVISGILTVDRTKAAWETIAKDVKSAISANDEQFDKILSLSYAHLPHHLRPCFLYMGGFPQDYEMRVSKLIKQWLAEGFLKPNGHNEVFEDMAEEYVEDLVKRHLVLVTKRKSNGRIKCVSMHDLMREMCIRKSQRANFILHVRGFFQQGIKVPPRLCISSQDYIDFPESFCDSIIRTVVWLKHHHSWPWYLECFRLLRIMDMLDVLDFKIHELSQSSLPDEVFGLIHLRYIACNCLFIVPAAISNLKNLQTLIIGSRISHGHATPIFVWLPAEIWRMPQLRHLIGFFIPPPFQEGATVALENLQTLSVASNFFCTPETREKIPNLKKLGLLYTGSADTHEYVHQLHNLLYLQQLENLKLEMQSNFPYWEEVKPAFPKTLKKLTLSGLGLPWEDLKIVGSLPNLEVLKLRRNACVGHEWETNEGEFSRLKFLLIKESDLRYWITESSHFPSLKSLVLRFCSYLSEIPYDIGEIPTLELIDVNYNRESLLNSAKQIQEDQQSCGNDALQVIAYKRWSADWW